MGQTILGVVSTIIANFIVEQITQFNTLKFLGQKIWDLIKVIWNLLNTRIPIWMYIVTSIILIFILIIYIKIKSEQEIKGWFKYDYNENAYFADIVYKNEVDWIENNI